MKTKIKNLHDSTITPDYDEETNTVDLAIGDKDGFRFVNLDSERVDYLIDLLTEFKNIIV